MSIMKMDDRPINKKPRKDSSGNGTVSAGDGNNYILI
jgi:hypothetical protein